MPPGRKRRAPADDEEDAETTVYSTTQTPHRSRQQSDDEEYGDSNDTGSSSSFDQLSKNLVRYALACEYSRTPIRRQDINQKILGSQSRAFRQVFAAAQSQLQDTFGVQMEELPNREKVTVRQKRAAAISESQSKTSNQWVLRNLLPERYRIPEIMAPPRIPTSEMESAYVGLHTMIISLISLSGGTLPEAKLERFLKRTNADQTTPVDKTDKLLARMVKEGYIVKIRDSSAGEELIDYMVGPRGKVEVGDEGVAGLVRTVYGEDALPDLEKRIERSLGLADRGGTQAHAANGEDVAAPRRGPGRPRREQDEDD